MQGEAGAMRQICTGGQSDVTWANDICVESGLLSNVSVGAGWYHVTLGEGVIVDGLDPSLRQGICRIVISRAGDFDLPDRLFQSCKRLHYVIFPMFTKRIPCHCLESSGLTFIDLSSTSIQALDKYAFAWCRDLDEVVFPSSLEVIANSCFCYSGVRRARLNGCTGLAEIGLCAWQHCVRLGALELPRSLKRFCYQTLYDCVSLERIDLWGTLEGVSHWIGCRDLHLWVVLRRAERMDTWLEGCSISDWQSGVSGFGTSCARPLPPLS
jgi:hypothetical protein